MAVGFKVINDAGTILVDSVSPALVLRAKQTVNNTSQTVPTVSSTNAVAPCFAVASSIDVMLNGESTSGSTRNFNLLAKFGSLSGGTIEVFKFDKPLDAGGGSTYGMKLYDAAGNLVFDALNKHARVLTVMSANGTFNAAAGRKVAMVILSSIFKDEITIDPIDSAYRLRTTYKTGMRTSNNSAVLSTVIQSQIRYLSSDTPIVMSDYGSAKALVIDVTGY